MALVRGSAAEMALLPNFSNTALTSEAYRPDMHSSESYVASSHCFRVSEDIDGHEIEFTIERVAVSLDHLVGGRKQLAGHGETGCLQRKRMQHCADQIKPRNAHFNAARPPGALQKVQRKTGPPLNSEQS
jgi:hypothetical protein